MKVTQSWDEVYRASVQVTFRVGVGALAASLADMVEKDEDLERMVARSNLPHPDDLGYEMAISRMTKSKAKVEENLRTMLTAEGYLALERERRMPDHIFEMCMAEAKKMFPELTKNLPLSDSLS